MNTLNQFDSRLDDRRPAARVEIVQRAKLWPTFQPMYQKSGQMPVPADVRPTIDTTSPLNCRRRRRSPNMLPEYLLGIGLAEADEAIDLRSCWPRAEESEVGVAEAAAEMIDVAR